MIEDLPCKFETFSGVCLVCGAGLGDECEVVRERARAIRRIAATIASGRAPTIKEVGNVIRLRVKP